MAIRVQQLSPFDQVERRLESAQFRLALDRRRAERLCNRLRNSWAVLQKMGNCLCRPTLVAGQRPEISGGFLERPRTHLCRRSAQLATDLEKSRGPGEIFRTDSRTIGTRGMRLQHGSSPRCGESLGESTWVPEKVEIVRENEVIWEFSQVEACVLEFARLISFPVGGSVGSPCEPQIRSHFCRDRREGTVPTRHPPYAQSLSRRKNSVVRHGLVPDSPGCTQ